MSEARVPHDGGAPAVTEDARLFRQLFDSMPQLGWTAQPDGFIDTRLIDTACGRSRTT